MITYTLGGIAEWVSNERLRRPDIYDVSLQEAMDFYRVLCAKVPFQQLMEVETFSTVAGTRVYTLNPELALMSVRIDYNGGGGTRLRRTHVRRLDLLTSYSATTRRGRPYWYARFGNNIEIHPVPDAVHTITYRYWPDVDSKIDEQIVAGTISQLSEHVPLYAKPWIELHKWETLYRLYNHLEQWDKAAMLIAPAVMPIYQSPKHKRLMTEETGIIPRLWNSLLRTVAERENVDEDFSINPVVRGYTL